ncbi:MAG: tRNA (adenosine(37)-N6)-threonylcarbamoyltransferase complex ATPase subunit type 1 TsaE [Alphaproteobacteria bacterium]|nr:tRNA (adenosine(37)-N6)-threonylcarbamoyltransferase complex ATPase subunit type 1 TsaE [Alphaproteobacteria bacterium]
MKKFICNSLDDTQKAAEYFSEFAKPGQCFALYGNLGFGKTAFAQYLIKTLNPKIENIISPTFNIIQTYPSKIAEIWHIDCYRLKSADEFYDLGIDEAFLNCITIIEWPEIIGDLLPSDVIKIQFSKISNQRIIETNHI